MEFLGASLERLMAARVAVPSSFLVGSLGSLPLRELRSPVHGPEGKGPAVFSLLEPRLPRT